jgi:hypothetical protein
MSSRANVGGVLIAHVLGSQEKGASAIETA